MKRTQEGEEKDACDCDCERRWRDRLCEFTGLKEVSFDRIEQLHE